MRDFRKRHQQFADLIAAAQGQGYYPYFRSLSRSSGSEVEIDGRRVIMFGSNDYLGLSHDPRVKEAAAQAIRDWGTGMGGSRFLNGNILLHEQLEDELADFVGKKHAVVHATGFMTNMGVLNCILGQGDAVLCDRENHASLFEGCRTTAARMVSYRHNDPRAAAQRLRTANRIHPHHKYVVTDGVFSMSGDLVDLPGLVALKSDHPALRIYLDDAHGIGVMGEHGRGTAAHYGLSAGIDLIMGTFSKALASVGGFVAGDDDVLFTYIRHHSRTLIFSAALPPSCTAAALASLEIIRTEPDRIVYLHQLARRLRSEYRRLGLPTHDSDTPILPILVGDEIKACELAAALLEDGLFAMPAMYPAVPRNKAIVRIALMSTHEEHHLDRLLSALERLIKRFDLRTRARTRERTEHPA